MENWMYQSTGPSGAEGHSPEGGKGSHSAPRVRRRNRLIASCLECRRRKLKCDKLAPCTNCSRFKRDCLYLASSLDPQSQQKLADIKERMGALEKNLEREVAGQKKMHLGGANVSKSSTDDPDVGVIIPAAAADNGEDFADGPSDEENLEPSPLTALDNVYEDNEDDELVDLGVQMGKMRISERIGGFIRPKLVEELSDTLVDVQGGKSRHSTSPQIKDHRDLHPAQAQRIQASPKSFIGPGPDYIAPTSSFFFPGTQGTSLIDYLPSKVAADQLIAQYFHAVHYVARAVHRPTLEAQYATFWHQIHTGVEPVPSQQAVVFATLFSAAVSMDKPDIAKRFATNKATLVESLRSGTEMALAKSNFLRTTKLDTMQAFVMYLIPLCRAEVSRAHSALVGTAIRLAECMGLHRDGSHYNMTAIETQVRRIIWHQLCFLDMRTCEATGPRPQIRRDDYDTEFPLNVNDEDLMQSPPPMEDKPYWTDMTFFRIRTEGVDLRRALWFDIVQIDKKKKTLTSTLVKIQKLRARLNATYLPMLDQNMPAHAMALHILPIVIQGCFVQVLHRYLFSTTQKMPDRLRQILIEAGVTTLDNAIALETSPALAHWTWYGGAFQQYHAGLLLMVEVYAYPMRKDAAKIWKCLDYIFEIPPHLTPKQKAELVITDLRDRMEMYHQMRKVRTTTQMEQRVSSMKDGSSGLDTGMGQAGPSPGLSTLRRPPGDTANTQWNPTFPIMAPVGFSPPPAVLTDSSGSRQNSLAGQQDTQMGAMDDIDWAEWDKYFPLEQNSGDLNIPDFDFANFNGGYGGQPMDISALMGGVANTGMTNMSNNNNNNTGQRSAAADFTPPSAEELAGINLTPAFFVLDHTQQQQNLYDRRAQ